MLVLKNKTCWITGAGSGIGEALAHQFAAKGANLILSGRNVNRLEMVKNKIEHHQTRVQIVPIDLTKTENLPALISEVKQQNNSIDYLINNAGVTQRALACETSEAVLRRLMEVNFFGTVALTKAVANIMLQQQSGHITIISSLAGKFGFPLRSGYSAAKHALQGYFETLRAEVAGKNINVLIVSPGRIQTAISQNALLKDGTAHQQSDPGQAKGMSVDICAKKIIKAIQKNQKDVVIGGSEVLMFYIRKWCPPLFFWLVRKVKAT